MSGNRLYRIFTWLLYGSIGFIIAPMLNLAFGKFDVGNLFPIGVLVVVTVYVSTAVHEMGHVIAGKLAGLKFRYVIIGPLFIYHENGHLKITRNRHSRSVGAVTGMLVPDVRFFRRRLMIYAMGGPLASLLLVIIFVTTSLILASHHVDRLAAIFFCAGLLTFASFLTTLVPTITKGLPTDGRRLLDLLRNGPLVTRWVAFIAINAAYESGQRPRDWDEHLVQQATLSSDKTMEYLAGMSIAYYHALDTGQADCASMWLDKIAAGLPHIAAGYRPGFQLELAYFTATQRQDALQAHLWLSQALAGIGIEQSSYLCAEAAVLLAEGKLREAQAKAVEGMTTLELSQNLGFKVFQRDRFQHIIDQVQLQECHD